MLIIITLVWILLCFGVSTLGAVGGFKYNSRLDTFMLNLITFIGVPVAVVLLLASIAATGV